MKEETKTAFNNMVEEMRMKGNKLKRYIFIDKNINEIWSFNDKVTLYYFIDRYTENKNVKLNIYNHGRVVSLHE